MTQSFLAFNSHHPSQPSGSSFNVKRKARSWSFDEDEGPEVQQRRIKSPGFIRRTTCPVPDLMADSSNSASDEDRDHHHAMDMDDEGDCDMNGGAHVIQHDHHANDSGNYTFGTGGSGGFGFGPGAEEDEEIIETKSGHYPSLALYPSLTPHPNPNHITNQSLNQNLASHHGHFPRATSPLSVQTFSPGLRGPATRGVFQPSISAPLDATASDIERARSAHGPQCKSIPKLMLSQYPDPTTGEKSMWTMCSDCGACERAH